MKKCMGFLALLCLFVSLQACTPQTIPESITPQACCGDDGDIPPVTTPPPPGG